MVCTDWTIFGLDTTILNSVGTTKNQHAEKIALKVVRQRRCSKDQVRFNALFWLTDVMTTRRTDKHEILSLNS